MDHVVSGGTSLNHPLFTQNSTICCSWRPPSPPSSSIQEHMLFLLIPLRRQALVFASDVRWTRRVAACSWAFNQWHITQGKTCVSTLRTFQLQIFVLVGLLAWTSTCCVCAVFEHQQQHQQQRATTPTTTTKWTVAFLARASQCSARLARLALLGSPRPSSLAWLPWPSSP